jgi:hypothetical protein
VINLIEKIANSNQFIAHRLDTEIARSESLFLEPNKNNDAQEYFLILEKELINDSFINELLDNHTENLIAMLVEKYPVEGLSKNITLILCGTLGNDVDEESLLKFEENPYHFKKNVISYSQEELSSMIEKLDGNVDNNEINACLKAEDNDGAIFEKFKTGELVGENQYYSLLVKLMAKLPFVHYIHQTNPDLKTLETYINKELSREEVNLLGFIDGLSSETVDIEAKIKSDWPEDEDE